MTNTTERDRLSWGDALFLYLEREGMPMNIASVMVFEGEIALQACQRFIESKLPSLPRYVQRVVAPPLNVGLPKWEFDRKFDIDNHIRAVTLKHGTDSEFKTLAGSVLSQVMNRERPLWDFTLVHGLKHNRTGLIARVHHCLADGIAGVGLMNVLMDTSPQVPPIPGKPKKLRIPRTSPTWTSALDGWMGAYKGIVQQLLTAQAELVGMAQRFMGDTEPWPAAEFGRLLPELARPTERLFFNVTYNGPQNFAWTSVPISQIKAVKNACGTTHNDVVLALIVATIRQFAESHGDRTKGRLLRIMVPVNLRHNGDASGLGNRISLLPLTVPLDIRDPRKLLDAVHERMEFLKHAHVAELVGLAGGLVGAAPTALQAVMGPVASLLPVTPFNLVCTNVPGPQMPLYLLGHKMLHWYPYVPVGGDMSVNCAILSYNGKSYFGFAGDKNIAPDLQRLEKYLATSFAELRHATATGPRPKRGKAKHHHARTRKPVTSVTASPELSQNQTATVAKATPAKVMALAAD